jgi:hypothetical protein
LYENFSFLPPAPPRTASQELLFRIEQLAGLKYGCAPYSLFATTRVGDTILWPSTGVSAPVDAGLGFGDPSTFVRSNTVVLGAPSDPTADTGSWNDVGATLSDMIATIALRKPGNEYTFTFSSSEANASSYVKWFPNFPACNAPGIYNAGGVEYGDVTVEILFEIYQAQSS